MSFKDLSKFDAQTLVKSDATPKLEPKAKSTGKPPAEGAPAPKKS